MRLIFTGGGTAGHVNPAIAVADAVSRLSPESEILFVGTPSGMENALTRDAGYPIWHIDIGGLKRELTFKNLSVIAKAARSLKAARDILDSFRPDAVFGTGGYVCYPIVREASRRGIFTALHESNAVPGLAVKLLSTKADRVYLNFSDAASALKYPQKAVTVGNPIRGRITEADRHTARHLLGIGVPLQGKERSYGSKGAVIGPYRHVLVSFGGSLGAETLNREMLKLMNSYSRKHPDTLHIHACGKKGYPEFMKKARELGITELKNVIINEFITELPLWLSAADAVICRAGANTVSELAAIGRASVLIPSPNVTADHQYKNAKALSDIGGAFVLREKTEELDKIEEIVSALISDRKLRENMELCAKKLSPRENAAETIAKELLTHRADIKLQKRKPLPSE